MSLRTRLIAGLLALLTAACAVLGVTTTLALRHFLVQRLDQQLLLAAESYRASVGGGRAAGVPGAVGTLGCVVEQGRVTVNVASVTDSSVKVSPSVQNALLALPVDGHARTMTLGSLGEYRVRAFTANGGDVLISGLPTAGVTSVLTRLVITESLVFAVVLILTGAGGAVFVRGSLRPLRRLTSTAHQVSELPLGSGEVALPDRVDPGDPRSEVGQVTAAFNRMLAHVEAALAQRHASEGRLRQFVADASHELRTPVAAIRGHAELARRVREPVPEPVEQALGRVESESLRMGLLVDDLLLLARLDAGRPLLSEPVDLTQLVLEAAGDARAAGPGHRWQLDLPMAPVVVLGDPHRLPQIVVNLLANARTHTPSGTTVTIGVAPDGVLTVADDGPGIPAALQPVVFERFVRASSGRSRSGDTGGSGLGLAIVRAIVAAHGGSITVESEPGRTVFRTVLPVSDVQPLVADD